MRKKMRFLQLVICTASLIHSFAYPQDVTLLKQPIPKSPDVTNLLKFIEHPVSVSSGLPETSVPIYRIQTNYIDLPISLNYHSGGIKVKDVASHVGMGWSLVAGGIIAQNIKGLSDLGLTQGREGRLNNPVTQIDDPSICDLKKIADNELDADLDIFAFTFCGYTGQFYIKDDYSIGLTSDVALKIEALPGYVAGQGFNVSSWQVTDVNGTKYVFGKSGSVDVRTVVTKNNQILNGNVEQGIPQRTQKSFYLTKIIQQNNEEIIFNYDQYAIRDVAHLSDTKNGINDNVTRNYQAIVTTEQRIRSITFKDGTVEFVPGPNRCDLYGDKMLDRIIVYDSKGQKIKEVKLNYQYYVGSQIRNVNELTFNSANVPYFTGDSYSAIQNDVYKDKRLFLKSVEDINVANSQDVQRYGFEYKNSYGLPDRFSAQRDWWGYYNANGKTTLLDNIFQDPSYLTLSHIYTTDHRNPNATRTSEGILTKITYPTGGYAAYEFEPNSISELNNKQITHQPVTYYVRYGSPGAYLGSLDINDRANGTKQIKFDVQTCVNGGFIQDIPFSIKRPDGSMISSSSYPSESHSGFRTYTIGLTNGHYELYASSVNAPCDYYVKVQTWYEDPVGTWVLTPVGGVRVKKSILYDPVSNSQLIKQYDYTWIDNGIVKSSGKAPGWANLQTGYTYKVSDEVLATGIEVAKEIYLMTSSPVYPLGDVLYDKITESRIDQNGNDIGRTAYTYLNNLDGISSAILFKKLPSNLMVIESSKRAPMYSIENNSWRRDKLLVKEEFANVAGQYQSVVKEQYYYSAVFTDTLAGLSANYYFESAHPYNAECSVVQNDIFGYSKYYQYSAYLRLDSISKQETFSTTGIVNSSKKYEYSLLVRLPSIITETNSLGKKIMNTYKYAGDYSNVTSTSDGILGLKQRYAIGAKVEESKFQVDAQGNNKVLLSSSFISYKAGTILPSKIYTIEMSAPLTNFAPSSVQGGSIVKDSRYREQLLFNLYDTYGNILEQQGATGVKETYLWGYRGSYPVARIVGIDYATVDLVIDMALLNNPSTTEAQLKAELNKLRTDSRTKNGMANTYTYKPLTGMASITTPAGQTTFYEYDGFGRLWRVKDHHGNILEEYRYYYKP
ncbi:RHS repeat domain-containing protein [Parapedobacter koreensis]|uniref:YD repeat-containing protein n=1 Tax=Parapedobacter koreensis TaxID=332977 RepID=A0A1H7HS57_9SPHI|nr:hypothetical protein [Parapedobacter koreensis]SEK53223.1 YD repeat-containing protein [Parapedobacter koreensis]